VNRNLRYIIIMMSVALAGIIIFQIYWISNSYDLHNQTFRNEVNAALEEVLNKETEENIIGHILEMQDSTMEPITIETYRIAEQTADRNDLTSTGSLKDSMYIKQTDLNRIVGKIFQSLATIHPELPAISEKYKSVLEERNITTPFLLAFSKNDSVFDHTGGSPEEFLSAQAVQKLPGINRHNEKVLAYFPETRSFLLKRMWMTLFASVFFVLLIAGSFFYMLAMLVRQKKLSDIKNDFINNMTHELKTPIATVSAAMEALVQFDALNDRNKSLKYIELSRHELNRLGGMVENVLRISTFEKQQLVLFKETFNISTVLEETAQKFILQNPDRVVFRFDLRGPGYIHADKFHLQNVINNLFDNAVKYSGNNAVLDVSCYRENEFVVFVVRDHGMGISKEQQKHIFDKFYRVPTGDLHAVKGFGLGLAYVRQIVEAHGGTVGVKSQLGSGSEFTVALPEIQ
jgi:two-component system, OmpR family, phosphate regulon sensor histidine kinase PhoR